MGANKERGLIRQNPRERLLEVIKSGEKERAASEEARQNTKREKRFLKKKALEKEQREKLLAEVSDTKVKLRSQFLRICWDRHSLSEKRVKELDEESFKELHTLVSKRICPIAFGKKIISYTLLGVPIMLSSSFFTVAFGLFQPSSPLPLNILGGLVGTMVGSIFLFCFYALIYLTVRDFGWKEGQEFINQKINLFKFLNISPEWQYWQARRFLARYFSENYGERFSEYEEVKKLIGSKNGK